MIFRLSPFALFVNYYFILKTTYLFILRT
jgi:hypothetical protein